MDLSPTYLEWASRNLALNGFSGARHRLVQSDALEFLQRDRGHYGLIFVDPPTFSNSKRAEDFDVQRDHVQLLEACDERLTPRRRDRVLEQFPPLQAGPCRAGTALRDRGLERAQHPVRLRPPRATSTAAGCCAGARPIRVSTPGIRRVSKSEPFSPH